MCEMYSFVTLLVSVLRSFLSVQKIVFAVSVKTNFDVNRHSLTTKRV